MFRNKNYLPLIIIIILSGGMFNSNLILEEEAEYYEDSDFQIATLFSNIYEMETYVSGCERLMYKDGQFYDTSDIDKCKNDVTTHFDEKIDNFSKPDFKFFTMKDTEYRAIHTGNIYKIDILGTYCENADLNHLLLREIECNNEKISTLYMARNLMSGKWGFAVEGFDTINGKYLRVIKP